jgi:hypothetical protein
LVHLWDDGIAPRGTRLREVSCNEDFANVVILLLQMAVMRVLEELGDREQCDKFRRKYRR